jgi:hypothetical protein
MSSVVGYNRGGATANASIGSRSGGGGVDDILKRLGNVEVLVSELRSQVAGILALIPQLATKADVAATKADIADLKAATKADIGDLKAATKADVADLKAAVAIIPHLATKADIADVRTAVASLETKMIKWIISTVLTSTALAFSIAKFVH